MNTEQWTLLNAIERYWAYWAYWALLGAIERYWAYWALVTKSPAITAQRYSNPAAQVPSWQ